MLKNNKGFTLVEIVAVVALLGIISMLVFPKIFDLVDNSRKKIYLEDAIRLIAKAQYSLSAHSNTIEKPSQGEMIILTMKYLNEDDFKNTPNDGTYLADYSFVVVKNYNGKYIYSATIVEKTKSNDYRGVELSTEDALRAKKAIQHVKVLTTDQLLYADENMANAIKGTQKVTPSLISSHIAGDDSNQWSGSSSIIGFYTNPE